MQRLIDAIELENFWCDKCVNKSECKDCQAPIACGYILAIEDQPTISATTKSGKWIMNKDGNVVCSICSTRCLRDDNGISITSDFCPSCGALMRKTYIDGWWKS